MFNQNAAPGLDVLSESTRAFQAIAAEAGDYSQRLVAEGTAALGQISTAKSVPECMEILSAYSKKAFEENIQQMTRMAGMYASVTSDTARAFQALMMQGTR